MRKLLDLFNCRTLVMLGEISLQSYSTDILFAQMRPITVWSIMTSNKFWESYIALKGWS